MGRRRKRDRDLPQGMRRSHGAFYHVVWDGAKQSWHPLGRDRAQAFKAFEARTAPLVVASTGTVADMIDRFQRESLTSRKASTQRNYRSWAKPLRAVFGDMNVADITQRHARQYRDKHPHMVASQRQLTLLKTMLADAVEWGWIDANPLLGFRRLTEGRRRRFITDAEWAALLASAGEWGPLLRIAHFTALRKGDLLRLTWGDLKGSDLHVLTSKTSHPLIFELDADTLAAFDALRPMAKPFPKLAVFRVSEGRRLTDRNWDNKWWAICERAKVTDVIFHDVRRRRITQLGLQYGQEFAQRWAGHREAKTTAGYFVPPAIRLTEKRQPLIEGAPASTETRA